MKHTYTINSDFEFGEVVISIAKDTEGNSFEGVVTGFVLLPGGEIMYRVTGSGGEPLFFYNFEIQLK